MNPIQLSYDSFRNKLEELHRSYTEWICTHPTSASDVESFLKIISYLLHGRFKNASILPELLYCSSNLLTFWHNQILAKRAENLEIITCPPGSSLINDNSGGNAPRILKIKSTLTLLEYFEVFLEVSAKQLWGDLGRWVMILIIQSIKTGLRAALLFYYKVGVIPSPSLETVPRNKSDKNSNNSASGLKSDVFLELRTGRYIRKLHASPRFDYRDWKLPDVPKFSIFPEDLASQKLFAEVLHLMRPLSHLAAMAVWGAKSWKPWILSISLDLASLRLHKNTVKHLRPEEKRVLTRRAYSLLLYLLRSPFYDQYTKQRLTSVLLTSERIPILGRLFSALGTSIPEWQETYSYIWSDG